MPTLSDLISRAVDVRPVVTRPVIAPFVVPEIILSAGLAYLLGREAKRIIDDPATDPFSRAYRSFRTIWAVPDPPPTVGGGDDPPAAAPPQMLPMWTADP